jgi:hypothetical protein
VGLRRGPGMAPHHLAIARYDPGDRECNGSQ